MLSVSYDNHDKKELLAILLSLLVRSSLDAFLSLLSHRVDASVGNVIPDTTRARPCVIAFFARLLTIGYR